MKGCKICDKKSLEKGWEVIEGSGGSRSIPKLFFFDWNRAIKTGSDLCMTEGCFEILKTVG